MEPLTVRYYEAEDGSVILYDPEVHETTRIVEPVLQEGLNWTREKDGSFPLPRPRWEEKVYHLQEVKIRCPERGRPVFERQPESLRRLIERQVRRSVMNQIGSSFA